MLLLQQTNKCWNVNACFVARNLTPETARKRSNDPMYMFFENPLLRKPIHLNDTLASIPTKAGEGGNSIPFSLNNTGLTPVIWQPSETNTNISVGCSQRDLAVGCQFCQLVQMGGRGEDGRERSA